MHVRLIQSLISTSSPPPTRLHGFADLFDAPVFRFRNVEQEDEAYAEDSDKRHEDNATSLGCVAKEDSTED